MKVPGGATSAFDTSTTAFEGANSTLFLLLGGLSCFQRLRSIVGQRQGVRAAGARRGTTDPGLLSGKPAATTEDLDQVTLAVLGLLAAGQRLTDLCAEAATPDPAERTVTTARTPRRRPPLRTIFR